MINFLEHAEIIIYLLLLLVLFTTAIIFYKIYVLRQFKNIHLDKLVEKVASQIAPIFAREKFRKDELLLLMDSELAEPRREFERFLPTLANISSVAPLLGLLGTILGMIRSTRGILAVDNTLLLKGISDALVTTAIGIMIAIPAIISYNYFLSRLDRMLETIKEKVIIKLESI